MLLIKEKAKKVSKQDLDELLQHLYAEALP